MFHNHRRPAELQHRLGTNIQRPRSLQMRHRKVSLVHFTCSCTLVYDRLSPDLRPVYGWQVTDHSVGKLSAIGQPTRPTQSSVCPWLVSEYSVVIHVFTWLRKRRPLNGSHSPWALVIIFLIWRRWQCTDITPNSTFFITSQHNSTRSMCRDERVELVKSCCSNMADDEQAIVLACTSLVVFMLLHTQILFVSSNKIN